MTICPSRAALAAAAVWCAAAPVRAQDTTRAGAGLQVPARPQVHVVQRGETLWELARQYLGDPLLWPEIYRLNTQVIEDPHWIFPGEQLALGGAMPGGAAGVPPAAGTEPPPAAAPPAAAQPVPAAPPVGDTAQAVMQPPKPVEAPPVVAPGVEAPPPPPPPADVGAPTVFQTAARRGGARMELEAGEVSRYRPVRRGEFYAAGFLTQGEALPWGRVLGAVGTPERVRAVETSAATIYQRVELEPPAGASYQVGDSLLVAGLAREIPGWGRVVVPSGIVRVTEVPGRVVVGQVVAQFHRIVNGQVVLPVEPFHDPGFQTPVPVSNGLVASVIDVRDRHPVPNQQDIVFLDAGRAQGVALGDLFEVTEPAGGAGSGSPQPVALLQIVHLRDRSASGLIVSIYQPGIRPGQPARLIRKMPS